METTAQKFKAAFAAVTEEIDTEPRKTAIQSLIGKVVLAADKVRSYRIKLPFTETRDLIFRFPDRSWLRLTDADEKTGEVFATAWMGIPFAKLTDAKKERWSRQFYKCWREEFGDRYPPDLDSPEPWGCPWIYDASALVMPPDLWFIENRDEIEDLLREEERMAEEEEE